MNNPDVYNAPQSNLEDQIPTEQSGLFGIKGRLSVLRYMSRSLFVILSMAIIGGLAYFLSSRGILEIGIAATIALILLIPIFWISIALFVKRLHDLNMSGWWMLLAIVPLIGTLFSVFVGLKPGKKQGNRFGHFQTASGWEIPVGYVGIVLMLLFAIATIVSTVGDFTGIEMPL